MASLRDNFDQLFQRLRYGRGSATPATTRFTTSCSRRTRCWRSNADQGVGSPTENPGLDDGDVFDGRGNQRHFQANEFRDVWLASERRQTFDPDSFKINKQLESRWWIGHVKQTARQTGIPRRTQPDRAFRHRP